MNESKVSRGKNVLLCTLAVLIALVLLFPMLWMLNTSLKTEAEIFLNPPTFYPHTLNLKSYIAQIETGDFNMFRSFLNSLIISLGSMLIAVVLAVPASYAIARYRFNRCSSCSGICICTIRGARLCWRTRRSAFRSRC